MTAVDFFHAHQHLFIWAGWLAATAFCAAQLLRGALHRGVTSTRTLETVREKTRPIAFWLQMFGYVFALMGLVLILKALPGL